MSKKKRNLIFKNKDIEELVYGTDVAKAANNKKEEKDKKKEKQEKKKIKKQNKINGIKLSKEEENINKIKVDVKKEKKQEVEENDRQDGKIVFKKALDFIRRREAEERQEEKNRVLAKAITSITNRQKSVEYKEEQEYFKSLKENKEKNHEEIKKDEDNLTYNDRFRQKYVVTLSSGSKNKKQKHEKNRNAGKSIQEILSGEEFKDLWNKNDDSHDEK